MIVSPSNSNRLSEIVESFEARNSQHQDCDLAQFLPQNDDPLYGQIAIELMRVELENSWRQGKPIALDNYRNRFADLLSKSEWLRDLAFEDYRQKLANGVNARREDYTRYGIETHDWPLPTDQLEYDADDCDSIDHLGHEVQRLSAAICEFPCQGDFFDGLEIESQIGRGAFGRVFLARQNSLSDRHVVLKLSTHETFESQRLARLQHTNIVPIYSTHSDGLLSGICMPFLGRATLADVLKRLTQNPAAISGGDLVAAILHCNDCRTTPILTIPLRELSSASYENACLRLMFQVAQGLKHAVEQGILHRDLKPANILISENGVPLLLDFNVSDDIVPGGKICLRVGGTLPYMSPEQLSAVQSGQRVDEKSDVYSFGIVLCELLTLKHPFRKDESSELSERQSAHLESVLQEDLRLRRDFQFKAVRSMSASVHAIVEKCLAFQCEGRYQTFAEICVDIERHLQDLPLVYTPNRSIAERFSKWTARHPRLSSATSVTLVSLIVISSLVFFMLARNRLMIRATTKNDLLRIEKKLPKTRALLASSAVDHPGFDEACRLAESVLIDAKFDLNSLDHSATDRMLEGLSPSDATKFRNSIFETLFLLANSERRLARYDVGRSAWHGERAIALNRISKRYADRRLQRFLSSQNDRFVLDDSSPFAFDLESQAADISDEQYPVFSSDDDILVAIHHCDHRAWMQAIPILEAVCRNDPTSPFNHYLLATTCAKVGRLSDADVSYSVCLALAPELFFAHFERAKVRHEMRRFNEAIDDLNQALDIEPKSYEALANRAITLKSLGQYAESEADLSAAIRIHPDRMRAYFIRARVRTLLKKLDLAEQDREQGFKLNPDSSDDWLVRGSANLKERPDDALHDFENALLVDPSSVSALRNIAYVYSEHRSDDRKAIEYLNRVIALQPSSSTDIISRGVLWGRIGDKEKAIADVDQALKLDRDSRILYQASCAFALVAKEDLVLRDKSVALLGGAIQNHPRIARLAKEDPDLQGVRKHHGFRSIISAGERLEKAAQGAKQIGTIEPSLRTYP